MPPLWSRCRRDRVVRRVARVRRHCRILISRSVCIHALAKWRPSKEHSPCRRLRIPTRRHPLSASPIRPAGLETSPVAGPLSACRSQVPGRLAVPRARTVDSADGWQRGLCVWAHRVKVASASAAKIAAQQEWESLTQPDPRQAPLGGTQNWRRLGTVSAWLEWEGPGNSFSLENILSEGPRGAGRTILNVIKNLCDRHRLTVVGVVSPQRPYQTPRASQQDYESLAKMYEKQGFHVERGRRTTLQYPAPVSTDDPTA